MANGPNFGEFLDEIFADDDSDFEFEGFDLEDLDDSHENNDNNIRELNFGDEHWIDGQCQPAPLNFSGNPGFIKNVTDLTSPIHYFEHFINDDDLQDVVHETNLYATQQLAAKELKEHSRFKKWVETTKEEMRRFLSLLLAMTLVSQLELSEYWTTDTVTSTPFFRNHMSRDRFYLILSFFHLNNNDNYIPRGQEGHNPLYKLGRFYTTILHRFQSYYYPHKNLSIDECMVPWRGNLSFKTYNPDKPSKYGLKAYMLCDASNGYCTKFKLYTGKSSVQISENGATYDLVMDLLRGYYGKGHVIYCDNYYSSPKLFGDLWELGVGASGTVRPNRKGIPSHLKDYKLKERGEISVVHNGNMNLTKYLDSKNVYLLSTVSTSDNVPSGKKDPATGNDILRPKVVVDYNSHMGGVDRSDQMISYCKIPIKTQKWWKKVIFHLISMVALNSYIVYKSKTSERCPLSFRLFRRKLVHQLIEKSNMTSSAVRTVGRPQSKQLDRLTGRHFPEKIIGSGTKKNVTLKCVVCTPAERELLAARGEKRKRPGRESSYKCPDCNVALCVAPCFSIYHKYQEYKLAYKRQKVDTDNTEE